jgi:hypothetical protein
MSAQNRTLAITLLVLLLVAGCGQGVPTPPPSSPEPAASATLAPPSPTPAATATAQAHPDGLSAAEAATLSSLEQVDDYPLYTMQYQGDYRRSAASGKPGASVGPNEPLAVGQIWACSLFAALGDEEGRLYGRNFDWRFSPALLLFTDPPGGYASVSMVDIAYLGFDGSQAGTVLGLPLSERRGLLEAPFWPFDGMNEYGLAVGMAAVPPGGMVPDPGKATIGSLGIIREILDHARDVHEAVAIFERYNVDMEGGPDLHYLVADRSGRSVLVEFYGGKMVVLLNEEPWHLATNFLRSSVDSAAGECWRYDRIEQNLSRAAGCLGMRQAMDLLSQVSQDSTQWSVVYGLSSGEIEVTIGREYEGCHTFHLLPSP